MKDIKKGVIFCILQLLVFSIAKDKMYLVTLMVSIILGIWNERISSKIDKSITYAIIIFSGINVMATFGILKNFIFNMITRRVFVLPAWINYLYFQFFDENSKLWWHQDVFLIDKLFQPIYQDPLRTIINNAFFSGRVDNPNAGFLAVAYAQLGWIGLIVYPFLVAVLFNIINHFYNDGPRIIQFMLSVSLALVMSNDDTLSTSFVMLMVIVVFYSLAFKIEKK